MKQITYDKRAGFMLHPGDFDVINKLVHKLQSAMIIRAKFDGKNYDEWLIENIKRASCNRVEDEMGVKKFEKIILNAPKENLTDYVLKHFTPELKSREFGNGPGGFRM